MSPDGKKRVAYYQKHQRKRTDEELKQLSTSAKERNSNTATCPHCGKVGQYTAMHRWHFDNCSLSPNPDKGLAEREKVRDAAIKRNQIKKEME